jgi:hypothetical protein
MALSWASGTANFGPFVPFFSFDANIPMATVAGACAAKFKFKEYK